MPSPRRQPTRGGNRRGLVFVSRVMDARSTMARLGGLMTLMVLMAACAGYAAAPSATPSAPAASPPDTPVSAPPSVEPSSGGPSTDPVPPVGGKPVLPKPGQAVNVHPVPADRLELGWTAPPIVRATWTSGVEPCTILDSIVVDRAR